MGDPPIYAEADTEDEELNRANDKALHNRGYMKAPDAIRGHNAETPLRDNVNNLRRILATRYMDSNETYTLRFRQVLDDPECFLSFDYIELCPKSVYGSAEGEDTH
jgi:hypothetical protein